MNKRQIWFTLILATADFAAYITSAAIAYAARTALNFINPLSFSFSDILQIWWIPLIIVISLFGTYYKNTPFWMEAGQVLKSLIISFVAVFAVITLGRMYNDVSRLYLSLLAIMLPFVLMLVRLAVKKILFTGNYFKVRTLLFADQSKSDYILDAFKKEWYMGLNIGKVFILEKNIRIDDIDNELKKGYEIAIIAPKKLSGKFTDIYGYVQRNIARIIVVPGTNIFNFANSYSGQIFRSQLGYISIENSIRSVVKRIVKRLFDLLIAILIMPVVFPVILILGVIIKLTSDGPVIFKQERVGKDGVHFHVYKLRTMYKDAAERLEKLLEEDSELAKEWEQTFKLKNDPRITSPGNFLRKTSLDELPQIFNVLKGEMSFVGPRPVLQKEIDVYYKENRVYYNMAKPGITGLWQISGRNDTTYDERIEMDCWYVFNWSLWLDIVILFCTPFVVLIRRGAY